MQPGAVLRTYGVARAMEVCEADNEVCRIREELQLLPQEMLAYIGYHKALQEKLQQLHSVLTAADSTAGYAELGAGRYQPSSDSIMSSSSMRSGAGAPVRLAQAEVKQRLADAVKKFASVGIDVAAGVGSVLDDAVEVDSEDGDMPPPQAAAGAEAL